MYTNLIENNLNKGMLLALSQIQKFILYITCTEYNLKNV